VQLLMTEKLDHGNRINPENPAQPSDSDSGAVTSYEAGGGKQRIRTPGSLQPSGYLEELPETPDEAEAELVIGPAEASPHWKSFYQSVSNAVAAMRQKP